MIQDIRELVTSSRTWLRIAYLVIAFPLATFYFIVVVTGLAVGFGLAILMVGLGALAVTVLAWRLFGMMERLLAIHMLGAKVNPFSIPETDNPRLLERIRRILADPVTWKSLVYVMLEFPFAIFSFSLVLTLVTVSLALLLSPFAYAGAALFDPAFPADAFRDSTWPGPAFAHSAPALQAMAVVMVGAVGAVMTLMSIAVVNGIGMLWGKFAELMLGVDDARLQLDAAKAEVKVQHERAESADRSRRELIVNASHELRTPVASISAHVETLLKPDRELDDETRNYLNVVAAESARLGHLVDDVLTLARADADELHLDLQPTDVEAVVAHVCDALAPLARRERNLRIIHASPSGLPHAIADRERLTQVLTNIVRNAVNHTLEGGIISVDTIAGDHTVSVTVADTGIGMEPEELERVFDRFYRTDDSRARDSGGSGLGLSIVRDLLGAMGGSISATSTPGRGSVFTVTLRREAA